MDVTCSACREPWDTYHLWQDAIYETSLEEPEAAEWLNLTPVEKLSDFYRARFREVGWEFGSAILHVRHCPCCPEGAQPDPEHDTVKTALTELLGDDEDGLAAELDDYGNLYER